MRIAVTGATGFLGRYLVRHLLAEGHTLACWYRPGSRRDGMPDGPGLTWVPGDLADPSAGEALVRGCDAVVHAALSRPGARFMGGEGDLVRFLERNLVGTIRLVESARSGGAGRFVFVSTCAVHDVIRDDRPLDEAHPLWPKSHYGAHKAAIEAFVHSFGMGEGYPIAALRPTGIYGLADPPEASKWFDLVRAVTRGEGVDCRRGGKEVHAADVARAVGLLLAADPDQIAGQAFNCCDRYISEFEVATLAREFAGTSAEIGGTTPTPKHQIETAKLRALGMEFGGSPLLARTVRELVDAQRSGESVP
jgi:nucleoside-diphosphate-sugar epimerase